MPLGLPGLPVIAELSEARHELFKSSHNWDQNPNSSMREEALCWLGHKVVTLTSLPANMIEAGACTLAFAAAACTLGSLKIAIFAVTLGNIKPSFPTGCVWFGDRALHGIADTFLSVGELAYDAGNVFHQGYRLGRWVAGKLHLGNLFQTIFDQIGKVFKFIRERFEKGIEKASDVEPDSEFRVPYPLSLLDETTKFHRFDLDSDERPLENIVKHYALSIFNIPLNAATVVGSGALAVALSSIFVAKVIIYSTTNIDIPVPTYAGQTIKTSMFATANTIKDITNDVADAFVLIYKVSEAIGLNRVVVSAMRVVAYIPEAIFG